MTGLKWGVVNPREGIGVDGLFNYSLVAFQPDETLLPSLARRSGT